jgi:hypothetical protein
MKRPLTFCLIATLLPSTAYRLPAPIQEQSPTPAPQESAKPKPKGAIKPRVTSESSQTSTKRATSSATKTKATSNRNLFDGVWTGTFGNSELLITITGSGTAISYLWVKLGKRDEVPATCNGTTTRWTTRLVMGSCTWTLTPNPDGKTALVTANCPILFGYKSQPTVFLRVSQ